MALTILLWIGRILLLILLVILVLLLLVLFVPIRYNVAGSGCRETGRIRVNADVTWLFKLVHLSVAFRKEVEGTEKDISFRIVGIDPKKLRRERKEKLHEKKKMQKKKILSSIRRTDPEQYKKMKAEAAERKRLREEERLKKREEERLRYEAEAKALKEEEDRRRRILLRIRRSIGFFERIVRAVISAIVTVFWLAMDLLGIIISVPADAEALIEKFFTKVSDICGTIREWISFLTDPRASGAFKRISWAVIKLVAHIRPRELKGDVTFGMDDPSATGCILAGVSALYPLYAGRFYVTPDFTEKKISGTVEGNGRLMVFYAGYIALRTWFDKDVVFARKFFKEMKEAADDGGEP